MNQTYILGVPFFTGSLPDAVDRALKGGHINAPSGPGLACDLIQSEEYRRALTEADMNITDSGIMVLAWKLLKFRKVPRYSGLNFLQQVMARPVFRTPGAVFWIMPNREESDRNVSWLRDHGYPVDERAIYLAPFYGPGEISDDGLVAQIEALRPQVVMLAIGGGNQERLARTLRRKLSYTPTLLCLGAAIAFITGGQAAIPTWADRLYLGWLLRVLHSPRKFLPRYSQALHIVYLIWKYGEELPPMRQA